MIEIFLIATAAVLSILGLSELVHMLCVFTLRPTKHAKQILCIVPDGVLAQQQIMLALHELKWHGKGYAEELVVISNGLSHEEKAECEKRFSGRDVIFVDSAEKLQSL